MQDWEFDAWHMARAVELAKRGEGHVEPNPLVGCTIVRDGETVGEGFHERFGGQHAEIMALASAGSRALGATVYVSLEPCCHHGKTPPCSEALIRAGVRRVVIALGDPFPRVAGGGIAALQAAGIEVEIGVLADAARELAAPYLKLVETARPWIIAKWAMTLDGKLATATGDSRWISSPAARDIVHRLRGRVDAIMVGSGTAAADDPLLNARPAGPRIATRIVVDSQASLSATSQLARTAREIPVLIACSAEAPADRTRALAAMGCEMLACQGTSHAERIEWLLDELGRRLMTNVLVEGGAGLLGSLFDRGQIDEVHAFIAPKLIGGATALPPIGGEGRSLVAQARQLHQPSIKRAGPDVYIHGRLDRGERGKAGKQGN